DADGTLWVGDGYSLRRFDPALVELPPWLHPDHAEGGVSITAVLRDAAGRLVVQSQKVNPDAAVGGYHHLKLWEVEEGRWRLLHFLPEANHSRPTFLLPMRDGSLLWPAASSGLERQHDRRISPIPAPWLPATEFALCALEDHEGGLWLGTENSGLFRLRQPAFQTLTRADGLPHDNTWTVLPVGSDVWVGTDDGLVRLGEKARGHSPLRDSILQSGDDDAPPLRLLGGRRVLALNAEPSGALWIGLNDRLARCSGGQLESVRFPAFWKNTADVELRQWNKLRCLATARDGSVWIGLPGGLMQMDAGGGRFFRLLPDRTEPDVRALLQTRDGAIWAGTHGDGLARFAPAAVPAGAPPALDRLQPGSWEVRPFDAPLLTTRDGLSSDRVWWLHEDDAGVLWAGTDHGLNRLAFPRGPTNAPATFAFTTKHGLPDNLVNYAVEDDHGHLWVAHDRGLYRVAKADLEAVADGRAATVRCVAYDEADGLLSREANGQKSQPAGAKTPDGRLWFCTTHGVAVVDPARVLADAAPPPPIALDRVVADEELLLGDGAAPAMPGPHPLAPGRARVMEFAYAATSFDAPDRLRYEYRLAGYETRWHAVGPRRVAYYTNLDPGTYRFEVRAFNREGVPSVTPAAFDFVLRPHFWQTGWFWAATGLAAAGLVGWGAAWRVRRARRAALAQERHRLARAFHDHLGADLTSLRVQAELARRELPADHPARGHLARLGSRADEASRTLRDAIFTLGTGARDLPALCIGLAQTAEDILKPAGVGVRFAWPLPVPELALHPEAALEIHLVARETLANVARHARARTATVGLEIAGDRLSFFFADDGCGFDVEAVQARPAGREGGRGLPNLHQHAVALGGEIRVESSSAGGTRVRLDIPQRRLAQPPRPVAA
ncbi:MAG: two-component regulator propeller domain-containing protein, partial [Limisphaerales bacterium]